MEDLGYLKENLKEWIRTTPCMSRARLAALCGISKRTLDNWLTQKGKIPQSKKTILELAISGNNKRKKNEFYKVSLNFSLEDFKRIEKMAEKEQTSVKKWIISHIRSAF